MGYKLVWGA